MKQSELGLEPKEGCSFPGGTGAEFRENDWRQQQYDARYLNTKVSEYGASKARRELPAKACSAGETAKSETGFSFGAEAWSE